MVNSSQQDEQKQFPNQLPQDYYAPVKANLPFERPLVFYLGHDKAFYLERAETTDEENYNVPQTLVDRLVTKRILPPIILRQGDNGMAQYKILLIGDNGPVDVSGWMVSFEGVGPDGYPVVSDEGFANVDAKHGLISWAPTDALTRTHGIFQSAHFKFESIDRTAANVTVDFTVQILENRVAWPKPIADNLSEYLRGIAQMHELQKAMMEAWQSLFDAAELDYQRHLAVWQTRMADLQAQMDLVQKQMDKLKESTDFKDLIEQIIKDNGIDIFDTVSDDSLRKQVEAIANEVVPDVDDKEGDNNAGS